MKFKINYFMVITAIAIILAVLLGGGYFFKKLTSNPLAGDELDDHAKTFYDQKLQWHPCESGMYCTTAKAPVDWNNPTGETIDLALIKTNAIEKKQGSLIINPGGPGASGYDWVKNQAMQTLSSKITRVYDVVSFDPRGIKRSAGIKCLDDKAHDAYRANTANILTDPGLKELRQQYDQISSACKANSGPILAHMDTASVAKDMDLLRALVGEQKLNYLGFSYGTLLGASYAGLFPQRAGKMVLDGAVDPAQEYSEVTKGQAIGFEQALRAFVDDCLSKMPCALVPEDQVSTTDAVLAKVHTMLTANEEHHMKTSSGRTVSSSMLASGIMVPLYNDLLWPTLAAALGAAFNNNLDPLVQFADAASGRTTEGTYESNSDFAFMAVTCLDYPISSTTASVRLDVDVLKKAAPIFGSFMAGGGLVCEKWPYKPIRHVAAITTSSQTPLLVIGTSGDPATPFVSAERLTQELGHARLLKWKGQGHTAYGRSNDCVRQAVDNFLLQGTLPEQGATC